MLCRLVFIAVLFPFGLNGQTVVIARKTKNAIYVAADSRITNHAINPFTHQIIVDTSSMRKIALVGNFNCVVIGGGIDENVKYASEACKQSTWEEVLKKYIKTFDQEIKEDILDNRKKLNPLEFSNYAKENWYPYYSQCIFFGIREDTLFIHNILCIIKDPNSTPVSLEWMQSDGPILFGGHIEEIRDSCLNYHKWGNNIVRTMKYFIMVEEKFHPIEVGGHIDLLKFTKKGIKWIPS